MPFQGFICGCGMELKLGDTWLSRKYPDAKLREYLLESIRQCGMQTILEPATMDFILDGEHSLHPMVAKDVERMRGRGFGIHQVADMDTLEFVKGITFDAPGCDREGFLKLLEPYFNCFQRDNTLIEFVPKGCSKAAGMLEFLEHLGISREDTLAIGDSTNDLPMFSVAKHTVCMGNGMEELKRKAEYITAPILEDGVEQALKSAEQKRPDVVLMDIRMPGMDGVEGTRLFKKRWPDVKIIVLTTFDDDEYVFGALKNGASGYLLKGSSISKLSESIRIAYEDGAIIAPTVATKVIQQFSHMAQGPSRLHVDKEVTKDISRSEWQIIQTVGCGMSNKEIARELCLSEGTVRNAISNILFKLGLRDRTQLAIWAVQTGVVNQPL